MDKSGAVGVAQEEGFVTSCGVCGAEDAMEVVFGTFSSRGMGLCNDGFCFGDAKQVDTSHEIAECAHCGHLQTLDGSPLDIVVPPRHPGITNLEVWIVKAQDLLSRWSRDDAPDEDQARIARELLASAELYFIRGLPHGLAQALGAEGFEGPDHIAKGLCDRLREKR